MCKVKVMKVLVKEEEVDMIALSVRAKYVIGILDKAKITSTYMRRIDLCCLF